MNFLQNIPIKRKLTVIIILTSGLALLLACAAFWTYDQVSFRQRMVRDCSLLATMISPNSTLALDFNDPAAAEETLRLLTGQPHIVAACVYRSDGKPFVQYWRADVKPEPAPPLVPESVSRFDSDYLELFQPISHAGGKSGSIYLKADLRELRVRAQKYAMLVVLVMLAAGLPAFFLSARLQRVISGPILHLAGIAHAVATERNYALRAEKRSQDELGTLIDGFNEMLTQIQERDLALQAAHDQLEKRVEERTRELQAEVVERKAAEANLEKSFSLLHATLESTADGILVVDPEGRIVSSNEKFAQMWRVPRETLAQGMSARELDPVLAEVKERDRFYDKILDLKRHPDAENYDVVEFIDGRVFERYSQPQRIGQECVGRVWSFRDITHRKQAELQLEKAHLQLLEASRRAGMAEVATGVLHNVGNVLNSANVSATLASDKLKASKLTSLQRATDLLREHTADLAEFLTRDDKGQRLPGYLIQLAEHLGSERMGILRELESLRKNMEHIKNIIAMQQAYAKVSGVSETINVTDLVDDTLRIHAGALVRHDVQVVREYEQAPLVTVDRHKVLQILVNLVRNAKYACTEAGREDKRVTLRVRNGNGRVVVSVTDNGIGISAENLTRIFSHGFTTRKDGHGFGLHSAALAAQELGGSLAVQSDGPMTGATFTLELPLQPPSRNEAAAA